VLAVELLRDITDPVGIVTSVVLSRGELCAIFAKL
jgi:hypothetical protein